MKTGVPFVDLARLHAPLRGQFLEAFARVLDDGPYVQGPEAAAFESEFAAAYGVPHALAVSNGTAALHLALVAVGVKPGDEVITVANTFIATAEAISMCGARPVFVDIEPGGFNMDPAGLEEAITRRTRAVIVVHLYGQLAAVDAIRDVTSRHGVPLIEDACQAHGARLGGRAAGTLGEIGCLSFYPTKNLGTVGEGGMVLTSNPDFAARMASLRNHGQTERHVHVEPGYNYRMSELQAAVLRVSLPHLDKWNECRAKAGRHYVERLRTIPGIGLPDSSLGDHVFHLFVIRSQQRDEMKHHLESRGIGCAIHYPTPIHHQPAYFRPANRSLPLTELAVQEILSLPMHPGITEAEVDAVCDEIASFCRKSRVSGGLIADELAS